MGTACQQEASSATIKYFFMILPLDNPLGCTQASAEQNKLILSPRIVGRKTEIISIYEPRKYREDKPGNMQKDGRKIVIPAMPRAMAVARLRRV